MQYYLYGYNGRFKRAVTVAKYRPAPTRATIIQPDESQGIPIFSGNHWKYVQDEPAEGVAPPRKAALVVDLVDFESLLPDPVVIEMSDIVDDTNNSMNKRASTQRILTRIRRNDKLSIGGTRKLANRLVTRTALTQAQADAIIVQLDV